MPSAANPDLALRDARDGAMPAEDVQQPSTATGPYTSSRRHPPPHARTGRGAPHVVTGSRLQAGCQEFESPRLHLKRSLANLAKKTLTELLRLIKTRLKRMQYRPRLISGFIATTSNRHNRSLRNSLERRCSGTGYLPHQHLTQEPA